MQTANEPILQVNVQMSTSKLLIQKKLISKNSLPDFKVERQF